METRLIDVDGTAAMLGVGARTIWRLRDAGRMPAPINIGKCIRWRVADIAAWIQAGCPDVKRTGWTASAAGCGGGCGKGGAA